MMTPNRRPSTRILRRVVTRLRSQAGSPDQVCCSLRDEHGFTTVGMAVALLLSLALLFSAAQVYRVESASAEIQETADAVALAAECEVAEFMVVARVCDAVILSMTLLATTVYGIAVVALCIPGAQTVSAKLIELAGRISEARTTFAEKAAAGLNAYQKALPFIAAAQGAAVAHANDTGSVADATYLGAALLIPAEGKEITAGLAEGLDDLRDSVEQNEEDLREATEAAEEAARKAQEAKERGYRHDCGDNPAYCLYERTSALAGLSGSANPFHASVDTWSFGVALSRAQRYYRERLAREAPADSTLAEQENSALRKIFYAYAVDQLARGYVAESETSFSAYFPLLPKNTAQMRETTLYDLVAFPITGSGESRTMHAWSGCPEAAGCTSMGSVRQLEAGGFEMCRTCRFKASSLGNVASASTNISNGFEYHYVAVAEAAKDYEKARSELDPVKTEVQSTAGSLFEKMLNVFESLASSRLEVSPPGAKGVIAVVVNVARTPTEGLLRSSLVAGGKTLGVRVAVSAATLIEEEADAESSVIVSILDGFGTQTGAAIGASRIVLGCWSALLHFYGKGQEALADAVESALSAIPLASVSGLGSWAASALRKAIEILGLQPADLDALKPVIINSSYVAEASDDSASKTYAEIKSTALAAVNAYTGGFAGLAALAQSRIEVYLEDMDGSFEIARIELPIGGLSIPITITLPSAWTDGAKNYVTQCLDSLSSVVGAVRTERSWR